GYLEQTLEVVGAHIDQETEISEAPVSLEQVQSVGPRDRLAVVEDFVRTEIARVLRIAPAGVALAAPLSSLGLDSLMAVELNHAVERSLGVVLPVTLFLRDGSGHDLAKTIVSKLSESPSSRPPSRPSRPPEERDGEAFQLSSGQEALWFLHQLAPESSAYNIATALHIRGDLVASALEAELRELVETHPALCTTYAEEAGRPRQIPRPAQGRAFALETIDASALGAAERNALVSDAANRPFDLVAGPVFRATLVVCSATEYILVL